MNHCRAGQVNGYAEARACACPSAKLRGTKGTEIPFGNFRFPHLTPSGCIVLRVEAKSVRRTLPEISGHNLGKLRWSQSGNMTESPHDLISEID